MKYLIALPWFPGQKGFNHRTILVSANSKIEAISTARRLNPNENIGDIKEYDDNHKEKEKHMKITNLSKEIEGVRLFEQKRYCDGRGWNQEIFRANNFSRVVPKFVQDNVSFSKARTIRGMHYQEGKSAQGKMVQVLHGRIVDVVLDIRKDSKTFGNILSVNLSDDINRQLYIPPGCAHGFKAIYDSVVMYRCTEYYNAEACRCIKWDSIGHDWEISNPIVSDNDKKGVPWIMWKAENIGCEHEKRYSVNGCYIEGIGILDRWCPDCGMVRSAELNKWYKPDYLKEKKDG